MTTPLPPIYRYYRRLVVHTEDMVRRFNRCNKYTVGTDLRHAAMAISRTVIQAVHNKPHQAQHVQALVWREDNFKLILQLSMELGEIAHAPQGSTGQAPSSIGSFGFHHFEQAATFAALLDNQCGGWWQALACSQRAEQTASTDLASAGTRSQPAPVVLARPGSLSGRAPRMPFGAIGPRMTKPCYLLDEWPRCKHAPWCRSPMWAIPTTTNTSISSIATSTTTVLGWCVPVSGVPDAKR